MYIFVIRWTGFNGWMSFFWLSVHLGDDALHEARWVALLLQDLVAHLGTFRSQHAAKPIAERAIRPNRSYMTKQIYMYL